MIDMVLKNKSSISYTQDIRVFIIVYGVKEYHNDVDTSVRDILYTVIDGTLDFQVIYPKRVRVFDWGVQTPQAECFYCFFFYIRPKSKTLSFENRPVGINTLNSILPNLCKAAGTKRKRPIVCVTLVFLNSLIAA